MDSRGPGRPRSQNARKAILQSTLKLLKKKGFTDLSIEAIAAHAGVGKATVYRWWPNKAALVVDAFVSAVEPELRYPTKGPAGQAIRSQMRRWTEVFRSPLGEIIAAVIGAGQSDPEILKAFHEHWVEPRRVEARKLLVEAMKTGEFRRNLDPDTILDILYGPLYLRLLVRYTKLDLQLADQTFDLLMPGLTAGAFNAKPKNGAR
jgi:AcrR family transcriptional regulator